MTLPVIDIGDRARARRGAREATCGVVAERPAVEARHASRAVVGDRAAAGRAARELAVGVVGERVGGRGEPVAGIVVRVGLVAARLLRPALEHPLDQRGKDQDDAEHHQHETADHAPQK